MHYREPKIAARLPLRVPIGNFNVAAQAAARMARHERFRRKRSGDYGVDLISYPGPIGAGQLHRGHRNGSPGDAPNLNDHFTRCDVAAR
jgi:hypothetical protein